MFLDQFKRNINRDILIKIIEKYDFNEFTLKTLNSSSDNELLDFIIKRKYNDFNVFIEDFNNYTKYDNKINTLLHSKEIDIQQSVEGISFLFLKNDTNSEAKQLDYIFNVFEDFSFNNKHTKIDYIIETEKDKISFNFSPILASY